MRRMGPLQRARAAWHKNSYEILGLVNGGLPGFVHLPWGAPPGLGIPVFHYHVVTPEALEADLRHLRTNGYTTIGADTFLAHLRGQQPVERSVLLTFDDGPRNFFAVAMPLLERFSARAIAFVAPGLHFDDASAAVLASPRRPMTWHELGLVHATGLIDIECHTLESRYVPRWPEPMALDGVDPAIEGPLRREPLPLYDDLVAARQLLEQRLPGKRVRHLAFPAYDGSEQAIDAARRAGYDACHWGVRAGRPLNAPGASAFHVSRLSSEFLRRLPGRGRLSSFDVVRNRWRVIRRKSDVAVAR